MKVKLCIKGRTEAPHRGPGSWVNILYDARNKGKSSADIRAVTEINPDTKEAYSPWRLFDEWVWQKTGRDDREELRQSATRQTRVALVVDVLIDNVCAYAGHAWLIRAEPADSSYRYADFLPLFEEHKIPGYDSLEKFLNGCIFPFLDAQDCPSCVTVLTKIQLDSKPTYWHQDRSDCHVIAMDLTELNAATDVRTCECSMNARYSYSPKPFEKVQIHNCLTWAAAVVTKKHPMWLGMTPMINSSPIQFTDRLKEALKTTGKMKVASDELSNFGQAVTVEIK